MYSVDPSGKHYVDDHRSTKIMLQNQLLACPSVLPLLSNKLSICLYTGGEDLIADTEFPAFASLSAVYALIPVELAHGSEHVIRAEVISCSKFPRITSQLTVTGQPCLPSEIPNCKQVKA